MILISIIEVMLSKPSDSSILSILTDGMTKKHTMVMPGLANVEDGTGFAIADPASAGSDYVLLDTEPPVGTFIQFNNHNKVYSYLGSGKIFPRLRKDVSSLVSMGRNVTLHYYINDTVMTGINYRNGFIAGIDGLSIWEAV